MNLREIAKRIPDEDTFITDFKVQIKNHLLEFDGYGQSDFYWGKRSNSYRVVKGLCSQTTESGSALQWMAWRTESVSMSFKKKKKRSGYFQLTN